MAAHQMPATRLLGFLLCGSILLAGCADSQAAAPAPGAGPSPTTAALRGAGPATAAAATTTGPSPEALMICTSETRADIAEALGGATVPAGAPAFADHLYTCTYRLPAGTLVLSVKDSPDPAASAGYFSALRLELPATEDLIGLGEAAYGTADGTVVLRKDNGTLRVDATALPPVFGSQGQKRGDFAYEIASVILGCWVGH